MSNFYCIFVITQIEDFVFTNLTHAPITRLSNRGFHRVHPSKSGG
jgi:hypothetical protein